MSNVYFDLIKTSWQFAGKRKPHFVVAYLMLIIANIILMLEPLVFALLLNHVQQNPTDLKKALLYLAAYPVIQFFFWLFHGNARYIERINSFQIVNNFRTRLFEVISALPLKWHKDHHSGATIGRIGRSAGALSNFVDDGFMYVETVVKFSVPIIALIGISLAAGVVGLFIGAVATLVVFGFNKRLIAYVKEINERTNLYDSAFYDYISNMRTVITLRLEQLAKNEIVRRFMHIFPLWRKNAIVNEVKWFLLSMLMATMLFSTLGIYLYQKISADELILIGTITALFQYTERFMGAFYEVAWKYEQLLRYHTDLRSVNPIFKAHEELANKAEIKPLPKQWEKIEIKKLNFRYEDEKHREHHLQNVHLALERGKKIAFIGESGSGKSTLMTLLRGLIEPDKVELKADNKGLAGLRALSNQVTLIPQDPEIFENTIEYNIAAGLRHNRKEILNSIMLARFDDVLARLPKGLKTNIKEKGVNLSGGEKQRLALARGIFAAKKEESSLILLDEPTSSVDAKNEAVIFNNLFENFPRACVMASVHRLNLLAKFDYIYLFANGKIIAEGNLEKLLKVSPEFQIMWESFNRNSDKKSGN